MGEKGKLNEGCRKVQASSYKVSPRDVRYNTTATGNCWGTHREVVKRVNPKSSHHKEKLVFFFIYIFFSISI